MLCNVTSCHRTGTTCCLGRLPSNAARVSWRYLQSDRFVLTKICIAPLLILLILIFSLIFPFSLLSRFLHWAQGGLKRRTRDASGPLFEPDRVKSCGMFAIWWVDLFMIVRIASLRVVSGISVPVTAWSPVALHGAGHSNAAACHVRTVCSLPQTNTHKIQAKAPIPS